MNLPESEIARGQKLFIESLRGGVDLSQIDTGLYTEVARLAANIIIPPERKIDGMLTIESIGEPRQGKTTFLNWVKDRDLGEKKIFTAGEFQYSTHQYTEIKNQMVPEKLREEVFWWALMDIQNFYKGQEKAESTKSDIFWVERGGNDAIAMIQAILATEPLEFVDEVLQDSNISLEEMTQIMKMLVDISAVPDVVALFLGTAEEAMKRRRKDGLGTEGRLINPERWRYLDAGYMWWFAEYYCFLKDNFGTGLIIIDGRKDSTKNNERIEEYILGIS